MNHPRYFAALYPRAERHFYIESLRLSKVLKFMGLSAKIDHGSAFR
ncbi:hypothetical protein AB4259_17425 [Vibrio amylolyticus]